jgi:hypothetical protein
MADIKGDLSGIADPGVQSEKISERLSRLGIADFTPTGNPVALWDLYGKTGTPVRATISEIGPLLLSRMLELNDTQESVLNLIFRIADDQGLLLIDLADLRSILSWVSENAKELREEYGAMASASIGAIQRSVLSLEESGGSDFFGEPALNVKHLMQCDFSGRGVISLLDATRLVQSPRLYSMFLLWLLSEVYEALDEVGDLDAPRLAFFFDEAHLLFRDAPPALLEKVEQVVRLIRSKGVGVYFATQHPLDVPDRVLAQLSNRFQHALRAFTPADQKIIRAASETFVPNPALHVQSLLTSLGIGEALVSVLNEQGTPTMVEHCIIAPPESRIGPLSNERRHELISRSPMAATYQERIDRESAAEVLKKRREESAKAQEEKTGSFWSTIFSSSGKRQGAAETLIKSVVRTVGNSLGREITRGILGSISRRR